MPINLQMPALSPTMEEGTLAKWLVKEGDSVSSGDLLAEIETDKATMEFEAIDEGVIARIVVAEGTENVKVGAVIAIIAEEGEDAGDVEAAPAPAAQKESEKPEPQATEDRRESDRRKEDKGGDAEEIGNEETDEEADGREHVEAFDGLDADRRAGPHDRSSFRPRTHRL